MSQTTLLIIMDYKKENKKGNIMFNNLGNNLEKNEQNNTVYLKGKPHSEPTYSHSVMGEGFYEFI